VCPNSLNVVCPNSLNLVSVSRSIPKKINDAACLDVKLEKEKSLWRTMKPMEPFSQDMIPQFQGYYQVGKCTFNKQ
jgi:hypothetical protein